MPAPPPSSSPPPSVTADVEVEAIGQSVSAQSIMGLMMLGAGKGVAIELRATGAMRRRRWRRSTALVEAGFHEQD